MRKVKKENVIEITEDVKVGKGIILEKGDKIRVIEGNNPYNDDEFWIIYTDKIDGEHALEGYTTEKKATKMLGYWKKAYPSAKIVNNDPMFKK